jgi:hypothetical protein
MRSGHNTAGLFELCTFHVPRQASQQNCSLNEAVKLRRMMFLVVDAGDETKRDWAQTLDAQKRLSYSAFEATMLNWRNALIRWRCRLGMAEVTKLRGTSAGALPSISSNRRAGQG